MSKDKQRTKKILRKGSLLFGVFLLVFSTVQVGLVFFVEEYAMALAKERENPETAIEKGNEPRPLESASQTQKTFPGSML